MSSIEYLRGKTIDDLKVKRRGENKVIVSFSIDAGVIDKLREHCEEYGMYMSKFIELRISEYLENC